MPANIVKIFADKTNKPEAEVEKLWQDAKHIADDNGHKEDYSYIVGILKRMLNINESASFKEYLISKQVENLI